MLMPGYEPTTSKFETLREQAEELLQNQSHGAFEAPCDILPLIHELKIHQAELEIQNEELQRAQQEIADLQREYADLYEFAPCAYLAINAKGIITRINLTGATFLGPPREKILISSFLDYIDPSYSETYLAAKSQAGKTGNIITFIVKLKKNGRSVRWVRGDIQAKRNQAGVVHQWRLVLVDITRQKEAELEREKLENQLRHAQKMQSIGILAGGVAHEFNNILSIIVGNTELAMDGVPEGDSVRCYLEETRVAISRAKEVVHQLLTFGRKSPTARTPTDIGPIVMESLNLIRSSIPASIEMQYHIPDDRFIVLADATQIQQVIINLCGNAADAVADENGKITIELNKEEVGDEAAIDSGTLSPGNYAKFVIRDNGQGIEKENMEHIFDPFFTTKETGRGSGMGLAVVQAIVDRHKGSIAVESEPDKGTVFTCLFPLYDGRPEAEEKSRKDLPKGSEHILFIDDESVVTKTSKKVLETLGYRITTSTVPKRALKMFKQNPDKFDLVITDMAMPEMTGDKIAREMLKIRPDLPIILCTGYSEIMSEKKAHKIGIRAFAVKPLDKAQMAVLIHRVLDSGS